MGKTQKVRMNVSIASSAFAYQPNQVVAIDADLARAWRAAGHCDFVNGSTPLTKFDDLDGLADLSAEEARRRPCVHCARKADFVLRNRPLCARHFKSEMES